MVLIETDYRTLLLSSSPFSFSLFLSLSLSLRRRDSRRPIRFQSGCHDPGGFVVAGSNVEKKKKKKKKIERKETGKDGRKVERCQGKGGGGNGKEEEREGESNPVMGIMAASDSNPLSPLLRAGPIVPRNTRVAATATPTTLSGNRASLRFLEYE